MAGVDNPHPGRADQGAAMRERPEDPPLSVYIYGPVCTLSSLRDSEVPVADEFPW